MKTFFTKVFTLLLFALLSCNILFAQVGSYTSYSSTVANSCNVNFKVFRDCAGLQLCAGCQTGTSPTPCSIAISLKGGVLPTGINHNIPATSATYTNTSFGNQNISVVAGNSALDVIGEACAPTICNNCNNRFPGTISPGIEVYTFSAGLNLGSLPSDACWISISSTIGNRPTTANSIGPNTPFFIETFVNRCLPTPNNSAIPTTTFPRMVICSGQEAFLNFSYTDPDGDSLSYRFAPILQASGTSAIYSTPFSAQAPFPHLGFGNPPNPPMGISIDAKNGYIRFTPIGTFKESLVLEVLEWRKVNGVNTLAGLTRHDLYVVSQNCSNSQPALDIYYQETLQPANKTDWNLCLDALEPVCFTIKSRSINSTPAMTWLSNDTNQFFEVTKFLPRQDSLKICLTSAAILNNGVLPYALKVFATERTCPFSSVRMRNITVKKFNKPLQRLKAISLGNYSRRLTLEPINSEPITPSKTIWQLEINQNTQQYLTLTIGDYCQHPFTAPGTYKIRTIVEGNCIDTLYHILLIESFSIRDSVLQHVLCRNAAEGKVQAVVSGAVGPLRYKINSGPFQNSPIFEGLAAGQYQLLTEDSIGQKDSILFTITQPATSIKIDSVFSQKPLCYSNNNGSIQLFASGGTQPLSFGLNQNNLSSNPIFLNLTGGKYLVKVVDNNNCIASDTVKLDQPDPIQIQFTTKADSCTNPPTGKISCNISGGTMPYYLNWINYNQSGQTEIDKLTQGYYYLRVTDQKACVKNDSVYLPLANTTLRNDFCKVHVPNPLQNKVELTWFKPTGKKIQAYQIYEAVDATSPLILKETRASSANPIYIDSIGNTKTKRYQIWSVDSCGRNSLAGIVASGITINTTALPNNMPKINWNTPQINGQIIHYNIYRKGSIGNFALIRTLFGNQTEFVDSNYFGNGQTLQYYVEANTFGPCGLVLMNSWAQAHQVTGTPILNLQNTGFKLFPNPAKQHVTIENSGNETFNTINLYGLQGKLIETFVLDHASKSYTLSLPQLAKGMYYLGISNNQTKLINLPLWVE